MYSVTALLGGRRDLESFRKRIRRSYGMARLSIEDHDALLAKADELEELLDEIVVRNNDNGVQEKETDSSS